MEWEVPLRSSIQVGQISTLKDWIAAGADMNAKDDKGLTPLHYAAREKAFSDTFKALISTGADMNALTTALGYVVDWESSLKGLSHKQFKQHQKEIIQILMDAGADIEKVLKSRP